MKLNLFFLNYLAKQLLLVNIRQTKIFFLFFSSSLSRPVTAQHSTTVNRSFSRGFYIYVIKKVYNYVQAIKKNDRTQVPLF